MTFNKIQFDQMTNMKAYSLISSRLIVKYTVHTRKIYVFLHYWTCYRSARLIYRIFTLNWTFHRDYLWQWRIKTHTHTIHSLSKNGLKCPQMMISLDNWLKNPHLSVISGRCTKKHWTQFDKLISFCCTS